MNTYFSFKKSKAKFMTVELFDGNTIQVGMPTKEMYDILTIMGEEQTEIKRKKDAGIPVEAEENKSIMDNLYRATSKMLSNNLNKEHISIGYCSEQLDFEDIENLYQGYMKFVNGEAQNPNL